MKGATIRAAVTLARLAAGPLALTGFFLPWTHGPGVLSEQAFSGYHLVGVAGRLQQLELAPGQGVLLQAVRLGILAVAVAATWLTLLAPLHLRRRQVAHEISGWYLVVSALVAVSVGIARAGLVVPPAGLALWLLGAGLFASPRLWRSMVRLVTC
ncbi:MAG: hypothetical protein ACYDCQ_09250 [Dehalococcoidia bacterium]